MPVNMEDLLYASDCRGPIVRQSCVVRNRERNEELDDEFPAMFSHLNEFLHWLPVYYHSNVFKALLDSFWS